jgi:hypothetical protein
VPFRLVLHATAMPARDEAVTEAFTVNPAVRELCPELNGRVALEETAGLGPRIDGSWFAKDANQRVGKISSRSGKVYLSAGGVAEVLFTHAGSPKPRPAISYPGSTFG